MNAKTGGKSAGEIINDLKDDGKLNQSTGAKATSADKPSGSEPTTAAADRSAPRDIALPGYDGKGRASAQSTAQTNNSPLARGGGERGVRYGETVVASGFGGAGRRAVQGVRTTSGRDYLKPPIAGDSIAPDALDVGDRDAARADRNIRSNEPIPLEEAADT